MAHCILVFRPASYCVIGPFDSETAAAEWGREHTYGPRGWLNGERGWIIIDIQNPAAAPVLYAPADAANIPELR